MLKSTEGDDVVLTPGSVFVGRSATTELSEAMGESSEHALSAERLARRGNMILSLGIGFFSFFRKFHISTFCILPEQMFRNLIKIMLANNFTLILAAL